ncbi:MAG: hypothetical protein INR62_01610 [Rhodospirillales bacterium]|nr:hypothetical protein [Acetobacter sp.]
MNRFCLRIAGTIFLCLIQTGMLLGQSPSPGPTPAQPLLARARDGSWTVAFKNKGQATAKPSDTKGKAPDPGHETVSLKIEKMGKTYHAIVLDASQARTEMWSMNGIEVSKPPGAKQFSRVAPNSPFYLDFSKADFDELSWIGMDDFKGVVEGPDGSKQFIFEAKNATRRRTALEHATDGDLADLAEKLHLVSSGTGKKQAEAKMLESQYGDSTSRAVLDVLSQLPVEYDDGRVIRTYSFSEAPVPIPPEVVRLMDGFSEQIRRATVPASPP